MFTSPPQNQPPSRFDSIKKSLGKLLSLYIENAKLTAVEKLTLVFSAAIVFFCGLVFLAFTLAFGGVAILDLLEEALSPIASAAILSGIFFFLAILLILLRKPLVINPIARFMAKLIMDIGKDRINN